MEIEIYADTLFLINWLMVFFIYYTVNKFIKNKVKTKKIVFGSLVASILYILLIIFIPFKKYINIIEIFLIMTFSIYVSFTPKKIKELIKLIFIVTIVSTSVGGSFIAIFYLTNVGNLLNGIVNNFSIKLLLISSILVYICIKYILKIYKTKFVNFQSFYKVNIHKKNKSIKLNVLLDTGNTLKEPISGKPVLIVEHFFIKEILSEELNNILKKDEQNNLEKLLSACKENDIRLIPYKSVGKEKGIMIGIKVDELYIQTENLISIKEAIIGISKVNISDNKKYGGLLPPEMLN